VIVQRAIPEAARILIAALLLGVAFAASTGRGPFESKRPSPASAPGILPPEMISADDAQASFERATAVFIDARHAFDFKLGHIKGARNIPLAEIDGRSADIAGLPHTVPLIVYCDGASCNSSIELAARLYEAGFSRVRIFHGGWQEWTARHLPTEVTP
jgi:rhodanese-related sulfurtransferase